MYDKKLQDRIIVCKNCKKEFSIFPSRITENNYCSRRCYGDSLKGKKMNEHIKDIWDKLRKERVGEKSPMWKGGISKDIEYKKSYQKKYKKENREYINSLNRKRRILKSNIEGSHTLEEWLNLKKEYNYTCPCCNKQEPEITLSEDHIIPIVSNGSDYIDNIQPLCRSCNSKKHTNIVFYGI